MDLTEILSSPAWSTAVRAVASGGQGYRSALRGAGLWGKASSRQERDQLKERLRQAVLNQPIDEAQPSREPAQAPAPAREEAPGTEPLDPPMPMDLITTRQHNRIEATITELSGPQQVAVRQLLLGQSRAQAARAAGVNKNTVTEWMNNPDHPVRHAYDTLAVESAEATLVLRQQAALMALEGLIDLASDADPKVRVQALDKLAKIGGLYTERIELSGPGGSPLDVRLTDDDLREELRILQLEVVDEE